MSPATKILLEKFTEKAQWVTPGHPTDIESFLDFIIVAYHNNDRAISLEEFLKVAQNESKNAVPARERNFSKQKKEIAAKLFFYNMYESGIKLINRFEKK